MSRGTDNQGGSTKIAVRVPTKLVDRIDAEYEERGYTSRSEAIRDALRAWVDAPPQRAEVSPGDGGRERGAPDALEELADSYGFDIYE